MGNTTPKQNKPLLLLESGYAACKLSHMRTGMVALVADSLRSLRTLLSDCASATDQVWDPDEPLFFEPGIQASRPRTLHSFPQSSRYA